MGLTEKMENSQKDNFPKNVSKSKKIPEFWTFIAVLTHR